MSVTTTSQSCTSAAATRPEPVPISSTRSPGLTSASYNLKEQKRVGLGLVYLRRIIGHDRKCRAAGGKRDCLCLLYLYKPI